MSFDRLSGPEGPAAAVPTSAFTPKTETTGDTAPITHPFEGRLLIRQASQASGFNVLVDRFGAISDPALNVTSLPPLDAELVQVGNQLVPANRGAQISEHPYWEWILEPGAVWQEDTDRGWSRAVLPFSLQERNANCTHNGLMSFLFRNDGSITGLAWQIASETCHYLQLDLWGMANGEYVPGKVQAATTIRQDFEREVAARLPVKPLEEINQEYPGVQTADFDWFPEEEVTTVGFVIDGMHFSGGCRTRQGPHPFCETLSLPSYSTAKSIFAGLAYMLAEKETPGMGDTPMLELVPECADKERWQGVTLEHLLDMSTGHYNSLEAEVDEFASYQTPFMSGETHAEKLETACALFPRRAAPGTAFSYHTSDTYLAGVMLNRAYGDLDIYRDILAERVFRPLNLSPMTNFTRRTYDNVAQPFTGFGLTYTADDIARIGLFLARDNGQLHGQAVLNRQLLDASLQRRPADTGIKAVSEEFRYNNGFWAYHTDLRGQCDQPLWIPYLSGYGGISVVLMPNGTVFYVFSDRGRFEWLTAAVASNSIRNFCPDQGPGASHV